MSTLTRMQRAVFAGVAAIVSSWLIRFLIIGSLKPADILGGLVFAAIIGGIVFWLAGYKDPGAVPRERG